MKILNGKFGSDTSGEFMLLIIRKKNDALCTADRGINNNNLTFEFNIGVQIITTNMGLLLELEKVTEYTISNTKYYFPKQINGN